MRPILPSNWQIRSCLQKNPPIRPYRGGMMKSNQVALVYTQEQQLPHPRPAAQHPFQFRECVEHRLLGPVREVHTAETLIRFGV